jgi:hypothetical protein
MPMGNPYSQVLSATWPGRHASGKPGAGGFRVLSLEQGTQPVGVELLPCVVDGRDALRRLGSGFTILLGWYRPNEVSHLFLIGTYARRATVALVTGRALK